MSRVGDLIIRRRTVRPQHAAAAPVAAAVPVPPAGAFPYRNTVPAGQAVASRLAESDAEEYLRQIRPVPDFAMPAPVFTPKTGAADTRPMQKLSADGRPYVKSGPLDRAAPAADLLPPVIGDSLPPLPAQPFLPAVPYGPERAPAPSLFAGPGWTSRLIGLRLSNGEWDDVHAIAERGLGRNAADMASGLRHNRVRVAEGMLQRLASIGHPELAAALLQRADEIAHAARAAAPRAGAA